MLSNAYAYVPLAFRCIVEVIRFFAFAILMFFCSFACVVMCVLLSSYVCLPFLLCIVDPM